MEKNLKKNYISSSLSIKHQRNIDIRREANKIEDIFKDKYHLPNVIAIPDEVEPSMPRIVLESKNGHSQILFSQTSIDFSVRYSNEYLQDYSKCMEYISDRAEMLVDALTKFDYKEIYYVGMINNINYEVSDNEKNVVKHLVENFSSKNQGKMDLYDFNQKVTLVEEDKYFVNLHFANYRKYDIEKTDSVIPEITSFKEAKIIGSGIAVNIDMNNRYQFNSYGKTLETKDMLEEVRKMINKSEKIIINSLDNTINTGVIEI